MKDNKLSVVGGKDRESITITNDFLANNTTFMAMGDLLKGYHTHEVAYALEKIGRRLNQAQKAFADKSEAIIKKYSELDEKGQPKRVYQDAIDDQGNPILGPDKLPRKIPVDFVWREWTEKNDQGDDVKVHGKESAEIEFTHLREEETPIDVHKLRRSDFKEAKLTVAQWMALDPLFDTPFSSEE